MAWTTAQGAAIVAPVGFTVVVAAGAGTGKTSVLSEVVAREMVDRGRAGIVNILALTFTRKAAAEMAERIEKRLVELAEEKEDRSEKERLLKEATDVADAAIQTIDAFAARLLRDYAHHAGLNSSYEILDPEKNRKLGEEVARECLERWLDQPPHESWRRLIEQTGIYSWPRLLVALESHLLTRGELTLGLVFLGRKRAEKDIADARKQELEEIRERIEARRCEILTAADDLERLAGQAPCWRTKGSHPVAYAAKVEAMAKAVPHIREWLKSEGLNWDAPIVREVAGWKFDGFPTKGDSPAIEAKKLAQYIKRQLTGENREKGENRENRENRNDSLRSLELDLTLWPLREAFAAALVDFHERFRAVRRQRDVLSYADCEIEALRLLENHPRVAEQLRNRFKFIVVDEFQDINPLQHRLISALSSPPGSGDGPPANLYVVGDERQSIYGFRDADCRIIRGLMNCPEARCCNLIDNFRACPRILNFVNAAFRRIWGGIGTHIDLQPAFRGYSEEADPPDFLPRVELHLVECEDLKTGRWREAAAVAQRLVEVVKGSRPLVWARGRGGDERRPIQWKDCAVLLRARAPMVLFEETFASYGIPVRTESGGGFWERQEIADIRSLLYCLSPLGDNLDWACLLRSPWVGLSDDALLEIAQSRRSTQWSKAWRDVSLSSSVDRRRLDFFSEWWHRLKPLAGRVPVSRLIEEALEMSGYSQRVFAQRNGRSIRANIERLIDFLSNEVSLFDVAQAADYIQWLSSAETPSAQATVPSEHEEGEVTLATVHAAKGLEWPLVVVADMVRKPKDRSDDVIWDEDTGIQFAWTDPATGESWKSFAFSVAADKRKEFDSEEEKRLLYVALTRAREWLILSCATKKSEKKGEVKWELERKSWLGVLNEAFLLENVSLVGDPSSDSESVLTFPVGDGSNCAVVKRVVHKSVEMRPPEQAQTDGARVLAELEKVLGTLPKLPKESSRRYILTASEIAAFEQCPRMFAYRAVWGVPARQRKPRIDVYDGEKAEQSEEFELPASELGNLAHRLMERVPFDACEAEIRQAACEVISEAGEQESQMLLRRLVEMAQGTLELDLLECFRKSERVCRELRLLGRIDDIDEIISARLDVAAFTAGRLVILDYKSGRVEESERASRAERYRTQMTLYALLASERFGMPAEDIETYVVFMDPPYAHEIRLDRAGIVERQAAIQRMSERMRQSDFTASPSPEICRLCDFCDICRESAGR